jgi:hypothetical protein
MPSPQLSYGDYLKAAFSRKLPVPMLGMMPANLMALGVFAVLGLANPGFWLLGAAAESAYLFFMAGNPRFQRLVRGERLLAAQQDWREKIQRAAGRLSEEGRQRYRRLVAQCQRVVGVSETLDPDSLGDFRDLRGQSLNQLLGIFLRLLTSRQIITDNVRSLDRGALASELGSLEKRIAEAEPGGALARSLEGTRDIQRKRLTNLERADENLKVIEAELERIEQHVELIREESAVTGKPEHLSDRLDAVTSAMSETSRWMDRHADFFDSLSGGEAGSALPELAEVPRATEGE